MIVIGGGAVILFITVQINRVTIVVPVEPGDSIYRTRDINSL